mmetsp:Transcript_45400/g.99222  ORF Transcript_45400/g.99222 Transcript_45400/m.99222 type:complete len:137 (+) Transcript_45400:101-511(+)
MCVQRFSKMDAINYEHDYALATAHLSTPFDPELVDFFEDFDFSDGPCDGTREDSPPLPSYGEDVEVAMSDSPLPGTKEYRRKAIDKWREKRPRRSFKKKQLCKARSVVAEQRVRKGGRFVKSSSSGFVSITEFQLS